MKKGSLTAGGAVHRLFPSPLQSSTEASQRIKYCLLIWQSQCSPLVSFEASYPKLFIFPRLGDSLLGLKLDLGKGKSYFFESTRGHNG